MGRRSDARTRLVSAADDLFRDRGFTAVGVAQLCAAASVHKGSFYHFFPSKTALLAETLERGWDETGMLRRWETSPPHHPIGQIKTYLEELFAFHYADQESTGRVRGSLVAKIGLELGSDDVEVANLIRGLMTREESAFASVLAAAADQGEVTIANAAQTAQTLVAALHGLVMLAKVRNDLSVLPSAETGLLRLVGVNETHD